jgi:hypothetical protein
MYNEEELKRAIISYMESVKMTSRASCVGKATIVLKVSQKLKMDESKEYLLEKAFDILVEERKVKSSFNTYDESGKLTQSSFRSGEEKFYLK